MQVDVVVLTSVVGTIIGTIAGAYGMKKSGDASIKNQTKEQMAVSTKLEFVLQGLNDIKFDLRSQDTKLQSLAERITKVEESNKSAHHILDTLESKIDGGNKSD